MDDANGGREPARTSAAPVHEPAPLDRQWVRAAALAVARHPSLWLTGARQALVLAAPGWWRRRPFLPLPAPEYLRFRLETAYGGGGDHTPEPADVITYLRWCQAFRRPLGTACPSNVATSEGPNARQKSPGRL